MQARLVVQDCTYIIEWTDTEGEEDRAMSSAPYRGRGSERAECSQRAERKRAQDRASGRARAVRSGVASSFGPSALLPRRATLPLEQSGIGGRRGRPGLRLPFQTKCLQNGPFQGENWNCTSDLVVISASCFVLSSTWKRMAERTTNLLVPLNGVLKYGPDKNGRIYKLRVVEDAEFGK